MSSRNLIVGLPLATGSALISVALLYSTLLEGAFILEWMGAFLAFYGLSYLTEPRTPLALSGAVLLVGSLGDIILLGGLTPLNIRQNKAAAILPEAHKHLARNDFKELEDYVFERLEK